MPNTLWAIFWQGVQNEGYATLLYDAHLVGSAILTKNGVKTQEEEAVGRSKTEVQQAVARTSSKAKIETEETSATGRAMTEQEGPTAKGAVLYRYPPVSCSVKVRDLTVFVGSDVFVGDVVEFLTLKTDVEVQKEGPSATSSMLEHINLFRLASSIIDEEEHIASANRTEGQKELIAEAGRADSLTEHLLGKSNLEKVTEATAGRSEVKSKLEEIVGGGKVVDLTTFLNSFAGVLDSEEFFSSISMLRGEHGEAVGFNSVSSEHGVALGRALVELQEEGPEARGWLELILEEILSSSHLLPYHEDIIEAFSYLEGQHGDIQGRSNLFEELESLIGRSLVSSEEEAITELSRLKDLTEKIIGQGAVEAQLSEINANSELKELYEKLANTARLFPDLWDPPARSRVYSEQEEVRGYSGTGDYDVTINAYSDIIRMLEYISHRSGHLGDARMLRNLLPVFEAEMETRARIYNPNIRPIFEARSEFEAPVNNPNVTVSFKAEGEYAVHRLNNPNISVVYDGHSDFKVVEIKAIPGVEVLTLPDERSQEYIMFKMDLIEVGHRDTAHIYWEYSTNLEAFTKHGGQPEETEQQEVSEAGIHESAQIEPPELETEKDYYIRAVGVTYDNEEVMSIHKGSVIRSFRTDFTTGGGRYENYIDARDLEDADALLQRGRQRLAEKGVIQKVELEYNEAGPYSFIEDFEVGDWVRVEYPGVFTQWMRIVEIIEEVTDEGRYLELRFGDKSRTIIDIIEGHRKEVDAGLRY